MKSAVLTLTLILAFAAKARGAEQPMMSLARFVAMAERGETLKLAFFGGSLTWGANASDPETTSWRGHVMEGLRIRYPKARWSFVDASIGGTGSELGAFRLERDVLAKKPNFVLLDFTLNDGLEGGEKGKDDIANSSYESIVRTCLERGVGILPVFLTRKEFTEAKSIAFLRRRIEHQEMARHYGIGFADVLGVLNADCKAGRIETAKMWPKGMFDTCHPHDVGYAAYAEAFFREWDRLLETGSSTPSIPEGWYSRPFVNVKRINAHELAAMQRSARLEMPYCTADGHSWLSSRWMNEVLVLGNGRRNDSFDYEPCEPIRSFVCPFEGTYVGLFVEVVRETVPFEVLIDGVSHGERSLGKPRLSFCRNLVLARDLKPGRHVLEVRPKIPEKGIGVVRIGALFSANSNLPELKK